MDSEWVCQLCGSIRPHQTLTVREMMFGSGHSFNYSICASCESLQLLDPPQGDLLKYYGPEYYSYQPVAQSALRHWVASRRDKFELRTRGGVIGAMLSRFRPELLMRMLGQIPLSRSARILDVGCGNGALLDRLTNAGFQNLLGADPFIIEEFRTPSGVLILKQDLQQVVGKYELIMFNHSLEHVPDIVASLRAARDRLVNGGYCLVRLPTTSSEAWKVYRENWVQIDAPRHFVVPSRRGLILAAGRAGFKFEKSFDDSTAFQFYGSELYRRGLILGEPRDTFERSELRRWEKRARVLNRSDAGDQVGFLLSVT